MIGCYIGLLLAGLFWVVISIWALFQTNAGPTWVAAVPMLIGGVVFVIGSIGKLREKP